jgi:hypothetical protein
VFLVILWNCAWIWGASIRVRRRAHKNTKFSFVYRPIGRKQVRKCTQSVTVLDCFLALVPLSRKQQQDVREMCIGHNMCVPVFCTTFVGNIFLSNKYLAVIHVDLHAMPVIFCPILNKFGNVDILLRIPTIEFHLIQFLTVLEMLPARKEPANKTWRNQLNIFFTTFRLRTRQIWR